MGAAVMPVSPSIVVVLAAGCVALTSSCTPGRTPGVQASDTTIVRAGTSTVGTKTAGPTGGEAIAFHLYTHCGLRFAGFAGRTWMAVGTPAVPTPEPNGAGVTTYDGYTTGTMTLVGPDELRFDVDETTESGPTKVVIFHPTSLRPPLCA